jgi:putative membrane protein
MQMKVLLRELGSGFLIGIANIIPGVSGGTFLLILGMYQRVMSAISGLNIAALKGMLQHAAGILTSRERKMHVGALLDLFVENDLFFLMKLGVSAVAAIVILSDVMMYLLSKQFPATYAFFFGLIIVSTLLSMKLVGKFTGGRIVMLVLGLMVTVGVTMAVNPADKAKTKSDHYRSRYEQQESGEQQKNTASAEAAKSLYAGIYTPGEFVVGALAGALGVSAMVLPGISGSLVLILVGQYHKVLGAISSLRTLKLDYLLFLMFFGCGMVIGGLLFARLVTFVFKRYYNGTIAFLTGLMAGSLYTLWPFKSTIVMDQYIKEADGISLLRDVVVRTNINVLPGSAGELAMVLICCASGAAIMLFLGRYSEQ